MNSTAKDLDSNSPATVAAADKERFSVLSSLTPDIARAMRRYRPRSMRKVPRAIARSTGVNSVRIVRPAITPTLANTIRSVTTLAEPWRLARAHRPPDVQILNVTVTLCDRKGLCITKLPQGGH
jgi:hypothetical protein